MEFQPNKNKKYYTNGSKICGGGGGVNLLYLLKTLFRKKPLTSHPEIHCHILPSHNLKEGDSELLIH